MKLLIPILLCLLVSIQLYASCEEALSQFFANRNDVLFESAISENPKWQQKLLHMIWDEELKKYPDLTIVRHGRNFLKHKKLALTLTDLKNAAKLTKKDGIWMPNTAKLTKEVASSILFMAKSKGLKAGADYVILPTKVIATRAVDNPVTAVFVVLSFGPLGHVLSQAGLFTQDPQFSVTHRDLRHNEVILLIKGNSREVLDDGNIAAQISDNRINYLLEKFPTKYALLDLSHDSIKIDEDQSIENLTERLNRELNGRAVRKVIVSSHGMPGFVDFDINPFFDLSLLGEFLRNINLTDHLTGDSEIYFDSCLLALDDRGKEEAQNFLVELLKYSNKSASLTVNRFVGLAGTETSNPFSYHSPMDATMDGVFILTSPVLSEALRTVLTGFEQRRLSLPYGEKKDMFQHATYTVHYPARN